MTDLTPGAVVDAHTRRRIALASLKEVEYDRVAGKLDEADYRRLKAQLEREALAAIQVAQAADSDAEAGMTTSDAAAGKATAAPPRSMPTTAAAAHACGFVNPAGSRYCAGCGQQLT